MAEIVGLGKAIELIYNEFDSYNKKLTELRDYYISKVKENITGIKVNGDMSNRLPGNANISFKGITGSELLLKLDEAHICTSAGSACSTSNPGPSHVLTAIGLDKEYLNGTLRVSFGRDNTKEDVDYLVDTIKKIVT